MGGLLSKFTNSSSKAAEAGDGEQQFSPITAADIERRANLLDTVEKAELGWFWASDGAGRLIYMSEQAAKRIVADPADLIGRQLSEVFLDDDEADSADRQRSLKFQFAARNSLRTTTVKIECEDRTLFWEIAGAPRLSAKGDFSGYHGIARDVTATIGKQRDEAKLSRFDSLTGLFNRYRITHKLEATITAFKASGRACGTILLDLDRFKQVNDTLGHPAGDELLKQVAARLNRIVGDKGEIGRLGGDEFQIILPDCDDRGELGDLAERIIQMLSQPYSIDGSRAIIGCSVGIAVSPYDGEEAEALVKAADLALYASKGGGRGQFRFYSEDLRDQASHRHRLEEDLRDAIAKGELEMHYQPIVDARSHDVACVEALMRWNHSERGMISPADFIPVAEEVGIIRELGEFAINEVCRTVAGWNTDVCAAVNVSAMQFASDNLVDIVRNAIAKAGVKPEQIELEITESVFVGDVDRALRLFKEFKKIGLKLALDDFGTGYSSLSYLREAPFDKIKIDQCFVRGCTVEDSNNAAIVAAVVSLAKAMKMQTVAEGVETKDELATLTDLGVTHMQGALFSRAIPASEIGERVQKGDLVFQPLGPEKSRADRRTEFRKINLYHEDAQYRVVLRNLSRTGARIEGLLDVPLGTEFVLDLGGGQLVVATVRRSNGFSQGLEFETALVSDGADGLCTRHRISPYQLEIAANARSGISNEALLALKNAASTNARRSFMQVDTQALRK